LLFKGVWLVLFFGLGLWVQRASPDDGNIGCRAHIVGG
jgi:hypothetical protein